jgi:predicted phosphohydrolase
MKIQVCSDLHLDINIKNESDEKLPKIFEYFVKPNPDCDCLALVGDIAEEHSPIYYKFLIWVSHQFKKVFIITGNHEYYSCDSITNVHERIKKFCNGTNLCFLNNEKSLFSIGNVTYHILGSTLWSNISKESEMECVMGLNDFKYISPKMSTNDYNGMHKVSVDGLTFEIREFEKLDQTKNKLIVLTHHAPLIKGVSHPRYESQKVRGMNECFSTDLSAIVRKPVSAWVFGHTHWCSDFVHEGCNVVSNCWGYGGEVRGKYKTTKILEI